MCDTILNCSILCSYFIFTNLLGWSDQFIIGGGLKTARDQARLSLAAAAKVTPIRIQNIELFEEPEEPALYVLFTIVDFLTGIDGVDEGSLADEVTRPLSEAVSNMKSVIKSGQLKIELPLIGGVSFILTNIYYTSSMK